MIGILQESVALAFDSLRAHKIRSALTLLGVLIGVFSITIVMTAMRIMENDMHRELSQLGTHAFQVQRAPKRSSDRAKSEQYRRRPSITYAQARALQANALLAGMVGVQTEAAYGEVVSRFGRTNPNIFLLGANAEAFPAKNWVVADGRGFSPADLDGERNVCVIGERVARKLFPEAAALGETVKFDNVAYTVVGVLEPKGEMFGEPQDNLVAIPVTTALKRYGLNRDVILLVQAHDRAHYDELVTEVRGELRRIRRVAPTAEDNFEMSSNDALMKNFLERTRSYRIGAAVVSSIALFAAGIGIMNIMLVSVTERTREIGVRRAVGAKKVGIVVQFVAEAVVTCQVGGMAGIVLGIVGGNIASHFVLKMPPAIPFDWMAIGLLICSVVGVLSGAYPAFKAAAVEPVEALRYE